MILPEEVVRLFLFLALTTAGNHEPRLCRRRRMDIVSIHGSVLSPLALQAANGRALGPIQQIRSPRKPVADAARLHGLHPQPSSCAQNCNYPCAD